jgi:hypothetical protein
MKIVIYQKGKWEYDKFVSLTTSQENYPLIKRGYKEKRLLLQYRLLYLFKLLLVGKKLKTLNPITEASSKRSLGDEASH